MLPDLLAENASGSWIVYIANDTHGFEAKQLPSRRELFHPHSGAFINLLEEYAAGPAVISLLYYFLCVVYTVCGKKWPQM